jgi:segregation and condensation protein A
MEETRMNTAAVHDSEGNQLPEKTVETAVAENKDGVSSVPEETACEAENTASVLSKHRYTAGQFEGPLDLLWALICDNKVNVYDIPISQITEQYLEYLDYAASTDLADLSEFYNMAARLIYIKSRMMLPVEVKVDDDEFSDPREELVDKLIEYQKFKKLSSLMEEKEDENEWSFERKKIQRVLPFDDKNLWEKIDTWDLLQQMQKMFRNMLLEYSDEKILDMSEQISVQEKITLMNEFLESAGECLFTDLIIRRGSEMDVICAFMAVLEAVKIHAASIYQNRMFGDIKICRYKAA